MVEHIIDELATNNLIRSSKSERHAVTLCKRVVFITGREPDVAQAPTFLDEERSWINPAVRRVYRDAWDLIYWYCMLRSDPTRRQLCARCRQVVVKTFR